MQGSTNKCIVNVPNHVQIVALQNHQNAAEVGFVNTCAS